MSGMRMSSWGGRRGPSLFPGIAAAALAAALPGCTTGDSSVNPLAEDASNDQTVVDAPAVETGAPVDASLAADARAGADDASAPDVAEIADAEGQPEAAAVCVPFDAGVLDGAVVEAGALLAQSLTPNCAYCHGSDYRGNLAVTPGAYSKNITPDPATGVGCWTDAQLVQAILYGNTPDGGPLCVMPQWSTRGLDAGQAEMIVQYLRSLPPIVNQAQPTDCDDFTADAGADASDAGALGDASSDATRD
jgi:hypothetical protein